MWCTPRRGSRCAAASVLAALRPTERHGPRPGPRVTAMASSAVTSMPASSSVLVRARRARYGHRVRQVSEAVRRSASAARQLCPYARTRSGRLRACAAAASRGTTPPCCSWTVRCPAVRSATTTRSARTWAARAPARDVTWACPTVNMPCGFPPPPPHAVLATHHRDGSIVAACLYAQHEPWPRAGQRGRRRGQRRPPPRPRRARRRPRRGHHLFAAMNC